MTEKNKSNLSELKNMFADDESVIFREFYCVNNPDIEFTIVFISGMVDKTLVHDQIIKPITKANLDNRMDINEMINILSKQVISAATINHYSKLDSIIQVLLSGSAVLFVGEFDKAIAADVSDWEKRAITEPESEKIITGPREGFTEDLSSNIVMIRRKLRTANLKLKFKEMGNESKTKICLCYLDNIADSKILKELETRLEKIEIDSILDVGYIQEMIKDTVMTPFKTIGMTERPDVVAGKLMEGRIAILCDGTPIAMTAPFVFVEYFNISEDYYTNYYLATLNRIIRWIGFFLASSVPAVYLALVTFHQEMIPTQLLLSISGARQNVPFPTIAEAILMLFVFELLRETSVRMPSVVAQTISIVGALVIGQAAVEAKLVSAPMIIVAALTGITSFVIPKMQEELIIVRLVFLLAASFIGLYGYIFCVIALFIHLASLRSFGIPYMLHVATIKPEDAKDVMIRAPWQQMKTRPKLVNQQNRQRMSTGEEKDDEAQQE